VALTLDDAKREYLARTKLIERFARKQAWRCHLSPQVADDLVSDVLFRLFENDYERLRKFRGESSLDAFLATTVSNLAKDFVTSLWGKWRTSSAAKRMGPIAVQLEVLLVREGLPMDAACETLRNRDVTLSRHELEEMAAKLPQRTPKRMESLEDATDLPSHEKSPDVVLAEQDAARTAARAEMVMKETLASWPTEDRLIVLMRFRHGRKISDIARDLGLPAHPLYNRLERLLGLLRVAFEAAGLNAQAVLEMLRYWNPDFGWTSEEL
jgi:RNA polymerase sigma factor (sigma-70 family)